MRQDINVEIMCVGAGGTGGNYLKELGRLIYSLPRAEREHISLSIVDGDIVEERNIARQPFSSEDVGLNKATAMAAALQEVFGLKRVTSFPLYIEDAEMLHTLWYSNQGNVDYTYGRRQTIYIMVGCVDNHHARKVMDRYFTKHPEEVKTLIYLDSANEFSVGEVVIAAKTGRRVLAPTRKHYYPDIFKGKLKKASEASCTELNEIAPQHLMTNLLAANILFSQTAEIIQNGVIHGGIVLFDAAKASSRYVEYQKEPKKG